MKMAGMFDTQGPNLAGGGGSAPFNPVRGLKGPAGFPKPKPGAGMDTNPAMTKPLTGGIKPIRPPETAGAGAPMAPMPQLGAVPSFDQRRANAMALYGPGGSGFMQNFGIPGPPAGGPGSGVLGPPQQADPFTGPRVGPPLMAGMGAGGGSLPAGAVPPQGAQMMMVVQRLLQNNPQLLMQLLGPYMS